MRDAAAAEGIHALDQPVEILVPPVNWPRGSARTPASRR